ncbi:hypothetical protein [Vibrio cortegadensis]|nr:hypothetical protein [Vibrio cortegadensis]
MLQKRSSSFKDGSKTSALAAGEKRELAGAKRNGPNWKKEHHEFKS